MDTARFSKGDSDFPILDLTARVAFTSPSSTSFDIGTLSNTLRLPTGVAGAEVLFCEDRPIVFMAVGWIDIHHPCEGHIKAQLRVRIPPAYHGPDQMRAIVHRVFEILAIPQDETYEAVFFSSGQIAMIEQATNREGLTDRLH